MSVGADAGMMQMTAMVCFISDECGLDTKWY